MPPIESLLLLIVVVEAVWIISSVFRGKEEEKKRPRGRPMPQSQIAVDNRPRPAPANVDQFLDEMNRRRREASEREDSVVRLESVRTDRPVLSTERRRAMTSDGTVLILPTLPAKEVIRVPPGTVPISVGASQPRPTLASQLPEFIPSRVTVIPRVARTGAESPESILAAAPVLHDQVMSYLRNRDSLRSAILLQEVLGPPLSMRGR